MEKRRPGEWRARRVGARQGIVVGKKIKPIGAEDRGEFWTWKRIRVGYGEGIGKEWTGEMWKRIEEDHGEEKWMTD